MILKFWMGKCPPCPPSRRYGVKGLQVQSCGLSNFECDPIVQDWNPGLQSVVRGAGGPSGRIFFKSQFLTACRFAAL